MVRSNKKKADRGKMIHVRLNPDVHQKLKIHTAGRTTSVQAWVSELIEKALAKSK